MLFVETTDVCSDICEKYVHAVCSKGQNFVVLKKEAGLHCVLHACTGWYSRDTIELSSMPALLVAHIEGGTYAEVYENRVEKNMWA
jgi:hypothetical protein